MQKRDLIIIAIAVILAIVMSTTLLLDTLPTASWGLSFRTEGRSPIGPASAAQLAQYDAVYLGDPEEKVIYLTFDAGYENGSTAKILDTLAQYNVPAAFFLVGNYLKTHPDLVRRMVDEGHIVGNHTMTHPDMSKISDSAAFEKELQDLEDLYFSVTEQKMPKFYRPPQGTFSEENLKMAKKLGYKTVFWSLAYVDWNNDAQPDPAASVEKLLSRTHNGMIVLLHSTSQTNAQILPTLLENWQQMGYEFRSIEDLFAG